MLITTKPLPMQDNGIPIGSIILAALLIGSITYIGYHLIIAPKIIQHKNPKS